MGSELDLDDAIASILADSDEDNASSKKKKTPLSKKKTDHNKSGKSLNSKALTSSVNEEDFYKNLSKIAEESNKDDNTDDVVMTEEDAKKMASDLAGLDDLDSDLLGSLGKKNSGTKVLSPRGRQTNDHEVEKHKDLKRKTSSGTLHRKGSVTPFKDEEEEDALGNVGLTDDDNEDVFNSSTNSTRSRHRKTGGSKKTPNKISPRASLDDTGRVDTKSKKVDRSKGSKSKEIDFDSDSDLPGLDSHETHASDTSTAKTSLKNRRDKKKEKRDGDLFGDDDDLPDLDGSSESNDGRSKSPAKRATSALDNLMGNKSKTSSLESLKKAPASLDEFMAKVSTTNKQPTKSEIHSPVKSPTAEETFQFGGYMPSAASGSGRRSRNNRPESAQEFGRRSVKFSDELAMDEGTFGMKKRPSTAPGGRKKPDEHGISDSFSDSLSGKANKDARKDKNDWLGLGDKIQESGTNKNMKERKADDFSPQASLAGSKSSTSGDWLELGDDVTEEQLNASQTRSLETKRVSKSSASGDWLGLGDDVTEEQLNASQTRSLETKRGSKSSTSGDWLGLGDDVREEQLNARETRSLETKRGSTSSTSGDWLGLGDDVTVEQLNASETGTPETKRGKTPERTSRAPLQEFLGDKNDEEETSKTLDLVPDVKNSQLNEDKSVFPWEGDKGSGRRRRPGTASPLKQESQTPDIISGELKTETRKDQDLRTNTTGRDANSATTSSRQSTERTRAGSNHDVSSPKGPLASVSQTLPDNQPPKRALIVDQFPRSEAEQVVQPKSDEYFGIPNVSQQANGGVTGKRLSEPRQVYDEVQLELDKQRSGIEMEFRGMMDKMQGMEKEKYKMELQLANKVAELETKIRRLELENENLVQTLEVTKQRHKDEISALEDSHRVRVQAVEESYVRREGRQKEEIELLIAKHKERVQQMETEKSDLQAANARKISALESSKLNEIERLNELHRRALEELRDEHNAEMNHFKKIKDQEVSATVTAYSHTKSLQTLMEQVLNSTKQVDDLHQLVQVSHKTSQQERDLSAKVKDEYLNQLHDRLLKQQTENEEERTRLQNLVAKMEVHVREQNRRLEEDKWKLNQEDSRLKSLRASLEEERRITREQLEDERVLLQRTKNEFLSEQKRMMIEINEERKKLSLERAELSAAQRGILNTEKHKQDYFTKLDVEQESARIRLVEDTAALNAKETKLRREQQELSRERQEFMEKQEKWNTEKDRIGKLALELEKRAQEIEELSLEAARVREDGTKSLETAQRMQLDIAKQASELEANVLLLQEKERQIAAERLASVKERRELEMEKRRGSCTRSQSLLTQVVDSNVKGEQPSRPLFSSESSPSSARLEVVSSPPVSSVLPLTPDLLADTLELKRTLRRWSQDKEQDEEFLAKESEFLTSLHQSRQHAKSLTRSQHSAIS